MHTLLPRPWRVLLVGLLFLGVAATGAAVQAGPASVTLAGSLQSELGCPGDWQPECATTFLTEMGNDVWRGLFAVPAGDYEYKMVLDASWANPAYPVDNKVLSVAAPTDVRFYFDFKTNAVLDSVNDTIAVAAGSFQSELGCAGDWDPSCVNTLLTDADGDGTYEFAASGLPAGDYETKVALDEDWATAYPGVNAPFTIGDPADMLTISFDSATTVVTVVVTAAPPPGPAYTVALVGDLQSELGCPGDWDPACPATEMTYNAEDDVWQATFTLPAGEYDYKVALDDAWDENYGAGGASNGANIALTAAGGDIKFYYDHKSHWITSNVNSTIVTAAGSFQSELGCAGDWQPSCLRSWLQDPDGDGIYVFTTTALPAGSYEAKAALNESWDVNYGVGGVENGANIPFVVANDGDLVTFAFDDASKVLTISAGAPPAAGPAYAIIHYYRADGDYGDHTTGDYNDLLGPAPLGRRPWPPARSPSGPQPQPFLGEDDYGRFAWVKLSDAAQPLNFIVHRGDIKDGTDADRSYYPGA